MILKNKFLLLLIVFPFPFSVAFALENTSPEYTLLCHQDRGADIEVKLKQQHGEFRNIAHKLSKSMSVTITSMNSGNLLPARVSFARNMGATKNVLFENLGLKSQKSNNFFGINSCVINESSSQTELPKKAADITPKAYQE